MKKTVLTTVLLITTICRADQLEGVAAVVTLVTYGILVVMTLILTGITIKNLYDIKKGKRQYKWLNIRAIATILLSLAPWGVILLSGLGNGFGYALVVLTIINANCLYVNNKENGI